MIELISAVAEGAHVVNELPIPPFMFGVLAVVGLLFLVLLTWAFRNTAHRNPEVSAVSPFQPFMHQGHPVQPLESKKL